MTSRRNHHLEQRGQRWYYVRRVPARFKSIDKRRIVRTTLCTDSLTIARERRDMMMDTDEQNWELALTKQLNITTADSPEMCRYRLARRKAQAVGFEFKPVLEIAHSEPRDTILRRVQTLREDGVTQLETEAVLGTVEPPKDTIRDAFKLYCDKLSISDQSGKSPEQIDSWKRAKIRAFDNFVTLCGNLTMDVITRQQGREFYDWWAERLRPDNGQGHTYRPNSANRELGNLRLLFREYWTYHGDETLSLIHISEPTRPY